MRPVSAFPPRLSLRLSLARCVCLRCFPHPLPVSTVKPPSFVATAPAAARPRRQWERRKDEARRLLAIFIPDVEGHRVSSFEPGSLECEVSVVTVLRQFREVWFMAHLVGW